MPLYENTWDKYIRLNILEGRMSAFERQSLFGERKEMAGQDIEEI